MDSFFFFFKSSRRRSGHHLWLATNANERNEADATNHRVYEKYTLEYSRRIGRKRRVEDVGETQRRRVECLDGSVGKMFDWQPKVPGSRIPAIVKFFFENFSRYLEFAFRPIAIFASSEIEFSASFI